MRAVSLITVLLILTLVLSGCSSDEEAFPVFLISDQFASILLADTENHTLLIAAMPLTALASYRGRTYETGDSADTPEEALERLSGITPSLVVTAPGNLWKELYQTHDKQTFAQRMTEVKRLSNPGGGVSPDES